MYLCQVLAYFSILLEIRLINSHVCSFHFKLWLSNRSCYLKTLKYIKISHMLLNVVEVTVLARKLQPETTIGKLQQ